MCASVAISTPFSEIRAPRALAPFESHNREPKTQTRPSSPDAGVPCVPRAPPPRTHTDTHGISATQPT
eukprot:5276755-Prymnesium_polylepis.1